MEHPTGKRSAALAPLASRFLKKPKHSHQDASVCTTRHLELALQIEQLGDEGLQFLLAHLSPEDGCRYIASLGALGSLRRLNPASPRLARVKRVLLAALRDKRPMVICYTLQSLEALSVKIPTRRVREFLSHGDAGVVAAAIMYSCAIYPSLGRRFLYRALHDRRRLVRLAAIDEADDANMVNLIPDLEQLSFDRSETVRDTARAALANLKGSGGKCRRIRGRS